MTAATAVTCACCQAPRPAAEVYERVPRSGEFFCRDTAGCRRRIASLGDPVGEVAAEPPPAVAGATCSVCATAGNVYERTRGVFVCLDRRGCEARSVQYQSLTAWTDSSPDRVIAEAGGHLRIPAARPVEVLAEQTPLDPAELAGLAAREALGAKRAGR